MSDPATPEPTIPPDIQARIASLPDIPPQGIHPHFIINENLEVDRAPPAALDPEGNNIALLSQLLPRLAGIASAAVDLLSRGNRAHQALLDRSSAYAAILRSDPAQLDRAGLYVEGLLLANALDATERAIAAPEGLPPLDVDARTMVQALLQLHAATILATREGQDAVANADRYQRTAEQEAALRADARAFAEQAQANSREQDRVFTPAAAATLAATADAAGQGPNPQRTAALSFAMIRNAAVVVTAMAALCTVVGGIGGAAIGLAAIGATAGAVTGFSTASYLLLAEGLKKWQLFARTAADIGHALDHAGNAIRLPDEPALRRRIAAFPRFTRAATPTLRRLATQGESFGWLARALDWVDRTNTAGRPTQVHHLTAIGITAGSSVGTPTLRLGPPPDFSLDEVRGCILHGEPVPDSWVPFVEELDLTFEASLDHGDFALPYQFQISTIHPVNFTDLTSTGRFSALRSLNIRGREVTDLGPLASLTALQSLDLGYNQVTDLTPLAALANLQSLNLEGTQIRNLSPLAGLPALHRLVVADTQVTDLSSLCGLSDDQAFFLFRTASIQGRLPNLEGNFTRADGSTATNNLQSLTELDISDTGISDLSPLLTLPSLSILDISRTKVETLSYLWGVKGLKKLILTGLPEGIETTLLRRAEIEIIRRR